MESSQMLITTYQSTRCHNKESHNIYLCSWKHLYLLLHPLFFFPPSSPSQGLCTVFPFQRTANNLSLHAFLGLPLMVYILLLLSGHNLCHLLFISFLFLIVFTHFARHVIGGVVSASISASAALSCAGLLTTYWSFNIFFSKTHF